ncbi:MAG TPA: hypothetical protein PL033_00795 [Candidatus Brocadiia bacterium]|nr:hypothetical protein [Candidatus Brocadiia bacterium]
MAKEIFWFNGDLQHHEDYSVPITQHCETVRKAGYDFICLQYKDMQDPSRIPDARTISSSDFLIISGSEQAFQSCRGLWAHFGLIPFTPPMPDTITDNFNIRQGLEEVRRRSSDCLIIVHHPADQRWLQEDFKRAYEGGARYMELNPEKTPLQSAVDLWDQCLSAGLRFYANLSTDAHGLGGIRRKGYVSVPASALKADKIIHALRHGAHVCVEEQCAVRIGKVERPTLVPGDVYSVEAEGTVWTRFIGSGGQLLDATREMPARYEIRGDEGYVRAELLDANGRRVFTQPAFKP